VVGRKDRPTRAVVQLSTSQGYLGQVFMAGTSTSHRAR